jgi:hypothetical protein
MLARAPVVNSACRLTSEVSEEDAAIVQAKVNLGLYPDTEAAIAEAIRLPDEHEGLLALRAKTQVGLEQLEASYCWRKRKFAPACSRH